MGNAVAGEGVGVSPGLDPRKPCDHLGFSLGIIGTHFRNLSRITKSLLSELRGLGKLPDPKGRNGGMNTGSSLVDSG